jgi:hypothetical protein
VTRKVITEETILSCAYTLQHSLGSFVDYILLFQFEYRHCKNLFHLSLEEIYNDSSFTSSMISR